MGVILKNNAVSTITTAISASDVGLAVAAGTGTLFPALGASDYFYATLVSAGGTYEVIKVTARVGDTMTIVRAQEGTTAQSFASGSRIEVRVTAASITDMVDEHDQASEIALTPSGYTTADDVQEGFDNLGSSGGTAKVGFLQAGSGAVARTTQAKLRDVVSIKDFGAVGDGVADDTAAIQAAFDSLDPALGGNIFFPPGSYRITTSINLPVTTSGTGRYEVSGYGATVKTTASIVMFSRTVANNTIALNVIGDRFTFAGLTLIGNQNVPDPLQWGFKFGPSYTSVFRDINFSNLGTGLDLLFCLNTIVDGCMATQCNQYGFRARNGDWSGAGLTNAGSNLTRFSNCRVFAALNSIAGFKIEGADSIVLQSCITEGATAQYGVFFDWLNSTTAKNFYVYDIHTEGSYTEAAIRIAGGGGIHVVDGWFHQGAMSGKPLIDSTGSGSGSEFLIANAAVPTDTTNLAKDNGSAKTWQFRYCQWGDMWDASKWVGGTFPQFMRVDRTTIDGQSIHGETLKLYGKLGVTVNTGSGPFILDIPTIGFRTSATEAAPTGGDVTRRMLVRDIAGNNLGYLALYQTIPNDSEFYMQARTAAQIASIADAINTTKKYRGKQVYDTTNNRVMVASGSSAGAAWYICDGSASVIPA